MVRPSTNLDRVRVIVHEFSGMQIWRYCGCSDGCDGTCASPEYEIIFIGSDERYTDLEIARLKGEEIRKHFAKPLLESFVENAKVQLTFLADRALEPSIIKMCPCCSRYEHHGFGHYCGHCGTILEDQ